MGLIIKLIIEKITAGQLTCQLDMVNVTHITEKIKSSQFCI